MTNGRHNINKTAILSELIAENQQLKTEGG